jgi:predicted nucleic acid-binding protein
MTLSERLETIQTLFFDTAPIIYYIEAHPLFGPVVKEAVHKIQQHKLLALSSVLTLTEVLPKPVQLGKQFVAQKFVEFLSNDRNLRLVEIKVDIARQAGYLRGKYPALRTLDALQISASIAVNADAFLTNDHRLRSIQEIPIIILSDYTS